MRILKDIAREVVVAAKESPQMALEVLAWPFKFVKNLIHGRGMNGKKIKASRFR